jgi:peptidoglycan/xylan/chitin deacetylase (PgdA/CDA1 family)
VARRRMTLPTRTRRGLTRVAEVGAKRVLAPPDPAGRRVVLCYHSVDPSPTYLSLHPALFDEHLAWLQEHCEVVSLDELVAAVPRDGGPYVAITFDDGYEDNRVHALPRLARRGMSATFFVTAGFLERDDEVMAHLSETWLTPRDRLRPLAWSDVHELRSAGMSIGSHTWSHRNLARLSSVDAQQDLTRAREVLEERLGEPVHAVAYPWGKPGRHVTDETFAAARRAGYELGVISLPRAVRNADDALRIPRFGIGAEPVARLAAKVAGAIDWHASVHERLPARMASLLFAEAGSSSRA